MPLKSVKSQEEFNTAVGRHGSFGSSAVAAAVHFWAEWCEPSKHMDTVFEQLASENPHANFVRVRLPSLLGEICSEQNKDLRRLQCCISHNDSHFTHGALHQWTRTTGS